jgi:hypothetical protein
MPIADTDILIKYTGGAANSDPNASLGGTVSSNGPTDNALHNLFDEVSGAESLPGDVEYRCFVAKNNHGSLTAKNFRIYISSDSGSQVDIALDGNGNNAAPESVGNESTAPSGETFSHPTTYAGGLAPSDIPAGQHSGGVWARRTIPAAATAETPHTVTMKFDFDTDA